MDIFTILKPVFLQPFAQPIQFYNFAVGYFTFNFKTYFIRLFI